jgi:hypothetical protein
MLFVVAHTSTTRLPVVSNPTAAFIRNGLVFSELPMLAKYIVPQHITSSFSSSTHPYHAPKFVENLRTFAGNPENGINGNDVALGAAVSCSSAAPPQHVNVLSA